MNGGKMWSRVPKLPAGLDHISPGQMIFLKRSQLQQQQPTNINILK